MTQPEAKRGIIFNESHLDLIRQYLEPGQSSVTASELAELATDSERIDAILDALQQEISNNVMPLQFIDFLMEDIVKHAHDLEKYGDKIEDELESFTVSVLKAVSNSPLILECMQKIVATDQAVVDAGLPTLLSEKARGHVEKIRRDQQTIADIIDKGLERYIAIYEDAAAKWEAYNKKS